MAHFRTLAHTAHYRWLWSECAKFNWRLHDSRARTVKARFKRAALKAAVYPWANRPMLKAATRLDRFASWALRPGDDFVELFKALQPDLVFNCSHIHGLAADLPLRIAYRMGIPTAVFVFSWDNLTSRSRIFVPYTHYVMWNRQMQDQLLGLYPEIEPEQVVVTGTPQFDFHFKPDYRWSREETCRRLSLDPARPYVLYTTGMDTDFPEEHRIVEEVIRILQESDLDTQPQLVVRTYIKGTTPEMMALADRDMPDVVFPSVQWQKEGGITPLYGDFYDYANLLRHASLGINAASTVSLELMMYDKPVVNLGLEPPGSTLPHWSRFARHIDYEHYRPVARSGAVMVARSVDDLRTMILQGLCEPDRDSVQRKRFLQEMFGHTLDGGSGRRVAEALLDLSQTHVAHR